MADILDLKSAIKRTLWDVDVAALPPARSLAVRFFRVVYVVLRDLLEGQLTLRAMSLVYTTLLSMVPVLAISFSVLKGFGVHNQVEPLMLKFLEPLGEKGVEITAQILGFVENMRVGVLGAVGLGLLIYTVISLMQKIERAFNFIWHVKRPRPLAQRFSDYLSVVLIGPVLLFSAVGISATVRSNWLVEQLVGIEPLGTVIGIGGRLVPFLMIVGAFSFFYIFITNTKVRIASAFVGGLAAGVMWQFTGIVFTAVVVDSAKYAAIYSAFATLIIFMIWLYVSWLILLVGASVAFYYQNPAYLAEERGELHVSNRLRERIALHVMHLIGRNYYRGAEPWTDEALTHILRMPMEVVQDVLEALERGGLLRHTDDEPPAYLPGKPPETTPVIEALDAVRTSGERNRLALDRLPHHATVSDLARQIDEAVAGVLRGRTLKDLALMENDTVTRLPEQRRDA